jgi:enoyl-CoA hydratase/carnithine racemase
VASARFERHGEVGAVVLDDPPLNLFVADTVPDISKAVDQAREEGVRALLFRAEGKIFTGGVDVHLFDELGEQGARDLTEEPLALTHKLEELPIPTLASVHGLCLTAGFELSLACDLIWAAESAAFGLVETVIGLTPLMGGTQRVAERAGPARARELVMTGRRYDAATMERWGVVNRVLPDDELEAESMRFASKLANGPTRSHAATKAIVRAQLDHGVRGADDRTADIGAPLFETEDLKRAVKTFLEKGPGNADFHGR